MSMLTRPCRHQPKSQPSLKALASLGLRDVIVAVLDVPGRAVVVTRACYDDLQEHHTS